MDGVTRELTTGDITAATLFQAGLGVPGRLLPANPEERREIERDETLFETIGCNQISTPIGTANDHWWFAVFE